MTLIINVFAIIILEFHLIEIMLTNMSRLSYHSKSKSFFNMMFYFWKLAPLDSGQKKYFMTQSKIGFILVMIKINYELEQRHNLLLLLLVAIVLKTKLMNVDFMNNIFM